MKRATSRSTLHAKRVISLGSSAAVFAALVLVGCGDDASGVDAGTTRDGGGMDAEARDAAGLDAAGRDGSASDGAPPDGGGATSFPGCRERTAAIVAATGTTISVRPAGDGRVMVDGDTRTLREVVSGAAEGTTILLEDGTYVLPEAEAGAYTGLYFRTPNVTMRSASNDPGAVVIDSAYRLHGGSTAPITIDAPGVVLSGFTVRRSVYHLIHLWSNADRVVLHDLGLVDGGQQFLKSSPGDGENVDEVEVSCSRFLMTDAGRDNVWGYGPTDGGTTCYTGGIDTHDARDWHVHDCEFEGIHCDASGTPRPAHGRAPEERGGMLYQGGLAEHAIHMWDSAEGSGHVLERNRIRDCARGIGIGLRAEVYGSVVRNNFVFSSHAGSGEHDVGIVLERAHDTVVEHNTVYFAHPDAYPNAIEYRWGSTSGLVVRNNLVNQMIRARDGASATLEGNVTVVEGEVFVDASAGDLHLARCDVDGVVDAASSTETVDDVDGEPRDGAPDVGADECIE